MLILRVEKRDGRGPYMVSEDSPAVMPSGIATPDTPTPYGDPELFNQCLVTLDDGYEYYNLHPDYHFGFISYQQFRKWFTPVLGDLKERGAVLTLYVSDDVKYSSYQAVFHRPTAVKLAALNIDVSVQEFTDVLHKLTLPEDLEWAGTTLSLLESYSSSPTSYSVDEDELEKDPEIIENLSETALEKIIGWNVEKFVSDEFYFPERG